MDRQLMWVDGWVDVWMDGWMDRWIDGWIDKWLGGCLEKGMGEWVHLRIIGGEWVDSFENNYPRNFIKYAAKGICQGVRACMRARLRMDPSKKMKRKKNAALGKETCYVLML